MALAFQLKIDIPFVNGMQLARSSNSQILTVFELMASEERLWRVSVLLEMLRWLRELKTKSPPEVMSSITMERLFRKDPRIKGVMG